MCSSTMREREVFWGNWGMSDGNDLIEEQIKMKMSDGMFQNKHTKRLFIFFFHPFLFHFVLHPLIPPHPPSKQSLLYLSHDVHPDDYGSDCVDDDCC